VVVDRSVLSEQLEQQLRLGYVDGPCPEIIMSPQQPPTHDPPPTPSRELAQRIYDLDESLFSLIEAQLTDWDARALLAIHAATAARLGQFAYLEVGSYLGGSLQVVMRDPRCTDVMSVDLRCELSPDNRGPESVYNGNTTARMLEQLAKLPDVDLMKLSTFDAGTDALLAAELPVRPSVAFVDGEHTDEAVLRDAYFCAEALRGCGVIAFHDYPVVADGISQFVRGAWSEISFALAFTGRVFAIELGGAAILRSPAIDRAVSSSWHSLMWRLVNRPKRTALPLLIGWSWMPRIDTAVAEVKRHLHKSRLTSGRPSCIQ
jgi:hypothetical protein